MVAYATLDFADCGELGGNIQCGCGASVGFLGFAENAMNLDSKGFAVWVFKHEQPKRFEKDLPEITCLFCGRVFKLGKRIELESV